MKKTEKQDFQPLRELALKSPYTMEYLSLMARRGELKVKKIGRIWYSTLDNIKQFEEDRNKKREERKRQLSLKYQEKSGKMTPKSIRVKVAKNSIFDQVQKELEEVLLEIREKEQNIKNDYIARKRNERESLAGKADNYLIKKEKQESEELSEKLIMDLGRLINTANRVYDDKIPGQAMEKTEERREETFSVPIRSNIKIEETNTPEGGRKNIIREIRSYSGVNASAQRNNDSASPFLSLNYASLSRRTDGGKNVDSYSHGDTHNQTTYPRSGNKALLLAIWFLILLVLVLAVFLLVR